MRNSVFSGIFGHFFIRACSVLAFLGMLFLAVVLPSFFVVAEKMATEQGRTFANSTLAATIDALYKQEYASVVDYGMGVMKNTPNVLFIVYSNLDGQELIISPKNWALEHRSLAYYTLRFDESGATQSASISDSVHFLDFLFNASGAFEYSRPIVIGGNVWGVLTVGFSRESYYSGAGGFALTVFVFTFLACLCSLYLFYVSSRRIRTQISAFGDIARQLAEGHLKVKAPETAIGEIGTLGSAINALTGALDEKTRLLSRLVRMVEQSKEGFILFDDSRHVVFANEALQRLTGYPGSSFVGLSLTDFNGRMGLTVSEERWKPDAAPDSMEVLLDKQDKSQINIEMRLESISIDDINTIFLLIVLSDIDDRKHREAERARLEVQLRESQKMEALGTLAGGIAHDFNNVLAAILGNVALAREDVGSGHVALVSLDEIGKASRRAKDLVQQILAFGRRQKLERKATTLALIVVESARLIRATLPASVTLNVDCRPDVPVVLADATQINQILINLCNNANQAIQDRGARGVIEIRLDAHTQAQAAGTLRPGRYARLSVSDDGTGMDEATRSRIFDAFFTTKPAGKGTGLGLSVVYGMVQAHDAHIDVESAPGKGSTFRIYFPSTQVETAEPAPARAQPTRSQRTGKRVLYVDDEEAIIFLMKRLLERQGYAVSGYTDPCAALAAVRADPGRFDLVVTDYNMPVLTGLDVAREIKDIRADLPVLLASGYITEELRQKAPAAGVRELIYKPNTADDLCEAVARFADGVITSGNPS